MQRTLLVSFAVFVLVSLQSGCTLHGQGSDPVASLGGKWALDKAFGVTPPRNFLTSVAASKDRVTIRSQWDEPENGQFGLTLLGITTPEFTIETTGREQAAQVGPFIFRYASAWENGRLATRWSTSEYMGSSFKGTWIRAVSKDGSTQTLDIDATSSNGQTSRARLIFRRPY